MHSIKGYFSFIRFFIGVCPQGLFLLPGNKKAGFWPDNILNLPDFGVNINSFQHIVNNICFLHKRKAVFS